MVFLEISQDSQENTCATVSFLIKLHWSLSIPPKNIWKPLVFLCISGSIERGQCHEVG